MMRWLRWLRWSVVMLGAIVLTALPLLAPGATVAMGRTGATHAPGERAPGTARVLRVTVNRPRRAALSEATVTDAATIRHFASLINALKPTGPSALDCTGKIDDPVVTFTFRAAPGGRVLARARQIIDPGAGGGFCEALTLVVDGHAQGPLLGGARVVHAAQHLLGLRVPR